MDFPASIESHIGYCAALLSKFSLALQDFVASKGPHFTPNEHTAVAVLQLNVLSTYVSFHVEHVPPGYRSHWEDFMPQMEEMVVLGEKIVSFMSAENDPKGQTTSFCSDMGFIIPLYTVASECRDPIIRRKAIGLLRSTSRQEGLWNSLLVAKAAERINEIEESIMRELYAGTNGLDKLELPSGQPFLQLDATGGRLQYVQQIQGGKAHINVVEEVFSW